MVLALPFFAFLSTIRLIFKVILCFYFINNTDKEEEKGFIQRLCCIKRIGG